MRYSILSSSTKSAKGFGIKMLLLILYISMAGSIHGQTVTRTECGCLNNETQLGNGQFQETISFNTTTGQAWVVESSVGLFLTSSPAPPADPVPLPANYPVTESPAGSGTYVLNAKRLDNTTYSLILYNGTTRLNVNSLQTCTYPRRDIFGDFGACIDAANKTYFLDIPTSRLVSANWSLSGGGNFVGSSVTRSVTVNWGNAVGDYLLSVSGTARAYIGQTSGFCNFSDQDTVAIVDEEAVPLACNNLVHLSMNGRCELMVLPDMVLEAPVYDESSYDIVLRDIQRDTIIPNRRISMDYLNKLIEVKVIHECSQNACWGLLKLEDKNIPRLECQDTVTIQCDQLTAPTTNGILRFPLRANTIVTNIGPRKYSVRNFDYCSDVILQYEDAASPLSDCDADYSSIITRTWFATDISGNTASCQQIIYIEKADAGDIVFPGNYDDVLGPNPSLGACDTDWIRLPNGHPSPETTGSPTGVFCLNVTVDYQDTRIGKCDGIKTFKLLRKWIISDLCTGQQIIRNQTISVMDNEPPIVVAPDEFTVGTQGLTCTSIINVPPPIVAFECTSYDYYVTYKVPDASGQPSLNASTDGVIRNADKTYTITKIPDGVIQLWICYIVVDACQNVTEACTEVDIIDSTPPVPVCDNYSFAGLNSDGIAYVTSGSLDDGSWDNCGIDTLEISRMDIISWGPGIKFTCADAGKSFMVQLRATDLAGNSNTCMVEVRVQDNTPPTLTGCPNDITIDCNADILNLKQYGFPTAVDLCGAAVTEEVKDNFIDGCGRGFITRVFTATDLSGNTATCDQIITVRPKNPFVRNTIDWPDDYTFQNGCASTGIEPQNMPTAATRFPRWSPNPYPCAQIAYDYKDLVFQYVEGFCFKVLRTWTVIDWCQYDPVTGAGIWTQTQVIKGQNTTPPNITKGCNTADIKVTQVDNCRSLIEATAEGTDDCTPSDKLLWNYTIDTNNDGVAEATGNTNTFTRTVDFGTIAIKWTATDECGNTKTCTANVSVKDQKKPTPYCLSEITTVVMAETGSVTIWASDFDHGSFDNCTPQNKLKFSFSTNTTETGRTFRCADLTANITNFELSMYVTDEAGNSDFCSVSINVQDNGNCPNLADPDPDNGNGNGNQNRIAISGNIGMEIPEMLEDAIVKITSEQGEFPRYVTTNDKGEFSFDDLAMNNDYSIQPTKNNDHLNGVSTLDLVLIQRHILNIKRLDTPFKIIAADANNDYKISATDLVNLRKLILGVIDKLPNVESWKFVDKNQVFPNPQIPFPYQQVLEYSAVDNNVSNANFIAVKTGDVNGSYQSNLRTTASENRSRNKIEYSINKTNINGIIELPVELNDISNLKGLQLNLVFDATKYDLLDIKSGNATISDKDYFLKDDNNLVISWINSDYDKSISGNLFTLVLQAKSIENTQDIIHLSEDNIHNEMYYDNNGEVLASGLELELRGSNLEDSFQVFQNTPNPFKTSTIIGFVVPQDEEVTLKVYDYTGAVLKKTQKYCNKGYNSFELNTTDLNKTGILFYTIETKTHSANKKMFVIK